MICCPLRRAEKVRQLPTSWPVGLQAGQSFSSLYDIDMDMDMDMDRYKVDGAPPSRARRIVGQSVSSTGGKRQALGRWSPLEWVVGGWALGEWRVACTARRK